MRAEYGAVQEKYQAPWNGGSWAASLGNRKWLATSTMCLNGNPVQTMSLGAKCSPKNKIHTENGVSAFKEKKGEDEYVMCAVLPKHQDPLPCSSFGGFSWYESLVAFAFSSSSLLYPTTKFVFPKLAKILAMAPVCLPAPRSRPYTKRRRQIPNVYSSKEDLLCIKPLHPPHSLDLLYTLYQISISKKIKSTRAWLLSVLQPLEVDFIPKWP
jgi:hypothetical protein